MIGGGLYKEPELWKYCPDSGIVGRYKRLGSMFRVLGGCGLLGAGGIEWGDLGGW